MLLDFKNFPKCYPVPEGTANTIQVENRINIQHISEKLERTESIE